MHKCEFMFKIDTAFNVYSHASLLNNICWSLTFELQWLLNFLNFIIPNQVINIPMHYGRIILYYFVYDVS